MEKWLVIDFGLFVGRQLLMAVLPACWKSAVWPDTETGDKQAEGSGKIFFLVNDRMSSLIMNFANEYPATQHWQIPQTSPAPSLHPRLCCQALLMMPNEKWRDDDRESRIYMLAPEAEDRLQRPSWAICSKMTLLPDNDNIVSVYLYSVKLRC